MSPLPIARSKAQLRAQVAAWRYAGEPVALVPTMGALHEGHLSLVRLAQAHARRVVASVFVNPTQFGAGEDFDSYPRGEAADAAALASVGCDLLYAPLVAGMYPQGFATTVTVEGPSHGLDGDARPGHFAGVATVVAKLLIQAAPDVAVFGEKDWQQLAVIRRLATDLDLPVEIVGAPISREPDGLARSSRNVYLSAAERAVAPAMFRTLRDAAARLADGAEIADAQARATFELMQAGFAEVDYVEVRDAATFARPRPSRLAAPGRILAAARLGRTRLIDNLAVSPAV